MPVWGTYTSAPDTSAPDIHPPYREANSTGPLPRLAVGILVTLCAAKLLLHLFTSVRHYGYFRDELYYLDMARHLDWGYVEPFDHYQRFGMGEVNRQMYLCRGVLFDIQKIWWHSHHWN